VWTGDERQARAEVHPAEHLPDGVARHRRPALRDGGPRVLWNGYPAEALRLLRNVRRHARDANVAPHHAGWTYSFEFDALLQLGRTEEAWRLVRRQLRTFWPRRWHWPVERRVQYMDHFVKFSEVPAAFFSGRYQYAAARWRRTSTEWSNV